LCKYEDRHKPSNFQNHPVCHFICPSAKFEIVNGSVIESDSIGARVIQMTERSFSPAMSISIASQETRSLEDRLHVGWTYIIAFRNLRNPTGSCPDSLPQLPNFFSYFAFCLHFSSYIKLSIFSSVSTANLRESVTEVHQFVNCGSVESIFFVRFSLIHWNLTSDLLIQIFDWLISSGFIAHSNQLIAIESSSWFHLNLPASLSVCIAARVSASSVCSLQVDHIDGSHEHHQLPWSNDSVPSLKAPIPCCCLFSVWHLCKSCFASNCHSDLFRLRGGSKSALDAGFEIEGSHLVRYHGSSRNVVIPKFIETLSQSCFLDCDHLDTIMFEDGSQLKRIEGYCFRKSSLKSICIPHNVESIDRVCFEFCTQLDWIRFEGESHLTRIGESCFQKSTLKSICIP
jgi:hypothetical protein